MTTEQYVPVVLFIMLYKVILIFESADEIPKLDHSNESYWAVLSCVIHYIYVYNFSYWYVLLSYFSVRLLLIIIIIIVIIIITWLYYSQCKTYGCIKA